MAKRTPLDLVTLRLSDRVALAVAARAIPLLPRHLQQPGDVNDIMSMLRGKPVRRFHDALILLQAHRMVTALVGWSTPWHRRVDDAVLEGKLRSECQKCVDEAMALPIKRRLVATNPANENVKIATPPAQRRARARRVKKGAAKR
jgi:hypothetical protein